MILMCWTVWKTDKQINNIFYNLTHAAVLTYPTNYVDALSDLDFDDEIDNVVNNNIPVRLTKTCTGQRGHFGQWS